MIDAVSHLLPNAETSDPHIDLDPRHILATCEDILDAAMAWQQNTLPLNELMRLGTIADHRGNPSPRYSRWVAMATAERHDPRRRALLDALEIVVKAQGIITRCGFITQDDLIESDANLRRAGLYRDPRDRRSAA